MNNTDYIFGLLAAAITIGGLVVGMVTAGRPKKPHKTPECTTTTIKPIHIEKPIQTPTSKPKKPKRATISPETIEAMHKQADAERALAEALERKAQYVSDPVKRARIESQAANSWKRFNSILDKIDSLAPCDE